MWFVRWNDVTAISYPSPTVKARRSHRRTATPATHVWRGVLEVRTAAKSSAPPIARFRFPCGLSTEPVAEAIRR